MLFCNPITCLMFLFYSSNMCHICIMKFQFFLQLSSLSHRHSHFLLYAEFSMPQAAVVLFCDWQSQLPLLAFPISVLKMCILVVIPTSRNVCLWVICWHKQLHILPVLATVVVNCFCQYTHLFVIPVQLSGLHMSLFTLMGRDYSTTHELNNL